MDRKLGEFNDIQKLLKIQPLNILHTCQTRWLSLEAVVNCLLDLFESLKIYVAFVENTDNIDTAKIILYNINNKNQIYL